MEERGSERSAVAAAGFAAGPVALLATLASPAIAGLPPLARQLSAGALLVTALVLLLAARRRAGQLAVAAATSCLVLSLFVALAVPLSAVPPPARRTLGVTAIMAVWWITVAVPIPATSLLPLALFPVLGILSSGATAATYANDNIFLFMGGFILALGVQRWGLHRRIALLIVRAIGTNPSRMVLGFMVGSAFLSMWISNTATTLMMLPLALAVVAAFREGGQTEGSRGFAAALMLGIAYAASIGGIATPIGTPPNIAFLRIFEILYPQAPSISFGRWTLALLPLTAVFLPVAWLLLTRVTHRLGRTRVFGARAVIAAELRRLGRMGRAERRMLAIFAATALLWITRADLELGVVRVPGWAGLLEGLVGEPFAAGNLHDATVAMTMALLTFVVRGDPGPGGETRALMDWKTARRLPWGILILFGGGFALAEAFKQTGLSAHLGEAFAGRAVGLSPLLLIAATCLLLTFLTEVTSNTATAQVMLPVLARAADAMGAHPLLLMIPATISASCAFMLPIATPPNAIVFGSGEVEMRDMVRAGLLLNLTGVALVTLLFYFVSSFLLGVEPSALPAWATG